MSDPSGPIVRLESVYRSFGSVIALDGVSLEMNRGEICGIIGRSGAGKSTLIRTINALEPIDTGRVMVEGSDLSTLNKAAVHPARLSGCRAVGQPKAACRNRHGVGDETLDTLILTSKQATPRFQGARLLDVPTLATT